MKTPWLVCGGESAEFDISDAKQDDHSLIYLWLKTKRETQKFTGENEQFQNLNPSLLGEGKDESGARLRRATKGNLNAPVPRYGQASIWNSRTQD